LVNVNTQNNKMDWYEQTVFYLSVQLLLEVYWWESQKEKDHWEDQDVGGWTILKWILER
jgi:hypothetical protein